MPWDHAVNITSEEEVHSILLLVEPTKQKAVGIWPYCGPWNSQRQCLLL